MKRILVLFAAVSVWHCGVAQFSIPPESLPRIGLEQTDQADVDAVLKAIGVGVFKFSLPIDTLPAYNVIIHLDEFKADSLAETTVFDMGRTYMFFTEEQGGPAVRFSDKLRIISSMIDPERPAVSVELVGAAAMSWPCAKKTEYPYATRLFAARPFAIGLKIPLLMFGSFWKDADGHVRFCGATELAPDDEMMKLSPHYYIVSLELHPAE